MVDLVFKDPPLTTNPIDLVFGELDGPADAVSVYIEGDLPGLEGSIKIGPSTKLYVEGDMPGLEGEIEMRYASNTARPLVNDVRATYQNAERVESGVRDNMQNAAPYIDSWSGHWQDAIREAAHVATGWDDAVRLDREISNIYQDAAKLPAADRVVWYQDADMLRRDLVSHYQEAMRGDGAPKTIRYQDALRHIRNWSTGYFQDAITIGQMVRETEGYANPINRWWTSLFQDAVPPPAGIYTPPGPQPPDPCYIVPPGDAVHLLFQQGPADTHLLFTCETHGPGPNPGETIVVPVRRVYVVLNNAVLRRVDGDVVIPTYGMSMSLDFQSWTWSFSATVPLPAFNTVRPEAPGEFIEVEATINGVAYRFLVESIERNRTFTDQRLNISGRGKAAYLDVTVMNFNNAGNDRTAQQIAGDILSINGVPLDWSVNWNPEDWLVPAGVWNHQGTYITALNRLVESCGAYLQPVPTAQEFNVFLKYPVMPWNWGDVTPDYELPADVVQQERMQWVDRANYNRVFVRGEAQGVLGQVTRTGTDGGLVAPMVVDALITHATAARQRGGAVLGATGRSVPYSLRMPVLEETGIIHPGKFIDFVDAGDTYRGIARGVRVDVGFPEIWQTLEVESYEQPV